MDLHTRGLYLVLDPDGEPLTWTTATTVDRNDPRHACLEPILDFLKTHGPEGAAAMQVVSALSAIETLARAAEPRLGKPLTEILSRTVAETLATGAALDLPDHFDELVEEAKSRVAAVQKTLAKADTIGADVAQILARIQTATRH